MGATSPAQTAAAEFTRLHGQLKMLLLGADFFVPFQGELWAQSPFLCHGSTRGTTGSHVALNISLCRWINLGETDPLPPEGMSSPIEICRVSHPRALDNIHPVSATDLSIH